MASRLQLFCDQMTLQLFESKSCVLNSGPTYGSRLPWILYPPSCLFLQRSYSTGRHQPRSVRGLSGTDYAWDISVTVNHSSSACARFGLAQRIGICFYYKGETVRQTPQSQLGMRIQCAPTPLWASSMNSLCHNDCVPVRPTAREGSR
jgi:hypothetical protein